MKIRGACCLTLAIVFPIACQKAPTKLDALADTIQPWKTGETKSYHVLKFPQVTDGLEADIRVPQYMVVGPGRPPRLTSPCGAKLVIWFLKGKREEFDNFLKTITSTEPPKGKRLEVAKPWVGFRTDNGIVNGDQSYSYFLVRRDGVGMGMGLTWPQGNAQAQTEAFEMVSSAVHSATVIR